MTSPALPPAELDPGEDLPPEQRTVPWSVLDALAAFVLSLGATLGVLVVVVPLLRLLAPSVPTAAATLPVSLLVLAATAAVYVRVRYPGALGRLLGWARPSGRDAVAGFLAGIGAFVVITLGLGAALNAVARLAGFELPVVQEDFRRLAADPTSAPLFIASAVVVAPLAEELFFRGMLLQAIRRRTGLATAAAVSALAFALAHAQQPTAAGNLVVVVVIFPLGLLLAWLFARRGSLLAPVVAHATYNLVQVVVLLATAGARA